MFNKNFTEETYLAANPDVARAIARGGIPSGWIHFLRHGGKERRPGGNFIRPLFFCHIPKAAGTTVRMCLEAGLPQHSIMPDAFMMVRNGGHYPSLEVFEHLMSRQASAIRLLRGHYPYAARELLNNPITIVVLRDPISRAISHLQHRVARGVTDRDVALADLDMRRCPPECSNLMTRILSARRDGGQDSLASALRRAKEALATVDILGIAEDMPSFAGKLASEIGVTLPESRKNEAKITLDLSERQIETLRTHNEFDAALYREALLLLNHAADRRDCPSNLQGQTR